MNTFETAKLVRKAAQYLGGPGNLARHLQIGRPYVMRFISGRSAPNAIVITELRSIITDYETTRAEAREKGNTNEYASS